MEPVKISEVANFFSLREELTYKLLLEWSEGEGIKVLHQSEISGEVCIPSALFKELKEGKRFFDSFICDQDLEFIRIKPGREYNQSYIYFLLEDDVVVYVGQTVNLAQRLGEHRKTKYFDDVAVSQVHKSLLDIAEQANIIYYNPALNGTTWNPKSVFKHILKLCMA